MGLFSNKKRPDEPLKPETPGGQLPTATTKARAHGSPADQFAIRELIGRFACGIDFRDWDAFAALFTTMVNVHLDPRTAPSPPTAVPIAAWKKVAAASFEPYDSTHHQVTVDYITFTEAGAEVVSHFQASHFLANPDGGPTFVQKGTYKHTCERTEEGWKISSWEQDVRWGSGNRAVLDRAMEAMPKDLF